VGYGFEKTFAKPFVNADEAIQGCGIPGNLGIDRPGGEEKNKNRILEEDALYPNGSASRSAPANCIDSGQEKDQCSMENKYSCIAGRSEHACCQDSQCKQRDAKWP
jgi:hypothetical protein